MTYVVINKYHSRIQEDGSIERFEIGDSIEPSEAELAAFPDRFRKLEEPNIPRRGRPPGVTSQATEDKSNAN
jgi:hypothetical protein